MLTSFRLVLLATALSVLLGIVVGIFSAARQYSSMDYGSTFVAFLCFSLPVFWLAVLLKEFGAIKFNDYLGESGHLATGDGDLRRTRRPASVASVDRRVNWRRRAHRRR